MRVAGKDRMYRPALWLGTLIAGVGIGACVTQQASDGNAGASDPFTARATAATGYVASSEPIVKAVQQAGAAVVSIDTTAKVGYRLFDSPFDEFAGRGGRYMEREVPSGAGSGVLLEGGYVLTNQHVVGDAVERNGAIRITLNDGRRLDAKAVGADQATDIALLQVQDGKGRLPVAQLGTDDTLLPGQTVIAIGNPVGLSASVSAGVVSALNRPVDMPGRTYEDLIQTDAPINPGNSGGALVDLAGRIVGINTLVRTDAQNIGFAIPIRTAVRIADELKRFGRIRRPAPGFIAAEMTPPIARVLGVPEDTNGIVLARVYAGSPAEQAGLQRGDVVTAIDSQAVPDVNTYRKVLLQHKIGDKITLTLIRQGQKGTATLRLGEAA